ncbi:MAG: hypothetical protein WCL38_03700 [Actinomycetota bacterium]
MRRHRTFTRGIAGLLIGGLLLAACSTSNGHAIAACKQVRVAIATYRTAAGLTGDARHDRIAHAQVQLTRALGNAAAATSDDGSFNALQTTISESVRVGISRVIPSLEAQCTTILAKDPYAPNGS